jgi:hypothetical protein
MGAGWHHWQAQASGNFLVARFGGIICKPIVCGLSVARFQPVDFEFQPRQIGFGVSGGKL